MSFIAGKFDQTSTDKYSEYLKEIGVGMLNRTLANNTKPTLEYISHGEGKWTQKIMSSVKNFEMTFQVGVEFDEVTPDDRKSKSTITIDGEELTHKQCIEGKYNSVIKRTFTKDGMATTYTAGNIIAKREFKRV